MNMKEMMKKNYQKPSVNVSFVELSPLMGQNSANTGPQQAKGEGFFDDELESGNNNGTWSNE